MTKLTKLYTEDLCHLPYVNYISQLEKNKDLVFEIRNWSLGKDLSKLGFAVFISIGRNVTFLKRRTSKESSLLLSTPQACRHMPDPFLNSTLCQCSYRPRLKLFLIFFYHFSYLIMNSTKLMEFLLFPFSPV